jgi:hypothetical protein
MPIFPSRRMRMALAESARPRACAPPVLPAPGPGQAGAVASRILRPGTARPGPPPPRPAAAPAPLAAGAAGGAAAPLPVAARRAGAGRGRAGTRCRAAPRPPRPAGWPVRWRPGFCAPEWPGPARCQAAGQRSAAARRRSRRGGRRGGALPRGSAAAILCPGVPASPLPGRARRPALPPHRPRKKAVARWSRVWSAGRLLFGWCTMRELRISSASSQTISVILHRDRVTTMAIEFVGAREA